MIGIAPNDIFPLNYPQGDPSLPACGAKVIPVALDWTIDNEYRVSLTNVQQQKSFGSLRCLWIDNTQSLYDVTITINGTNQTFIAPAASANYYPVINVNVPEIDFIRQSISASNYTKILFLNFVPVLRLTDPSNFPNLINVDVVNFPILQDVSIQSSVSLPVHGNITVSGIVQCYGHIYNLDTGLIIGTTAVNMGNTSRTKLAGIMVVNNAAVLASGTTNLIINSRNGANVLTLALPTDITSGNAPYTCLNISDLNITLPTGTNPVTAQLSDNLTSGSFFAALSSY